MSLFPTPISSQNLGKVYSTCQTKRLFENTQQEITKPSTSKAGAFSPTGPENSAENRSRKPAAKHYSAKATMEFNRNLVQDGGKKIEKADLRAKYPARTAWQGLTPPAAAAGEQKALYKQLDRALSFH